MPCIYLINVGSNTSHGAKARSPIFRDGSFVYVPFPTDNPCEGTGYADEALPYIRNVDRRATHADPDWVNLTYGDYCANPRAGALKNVRPDDVLLFWGLLWENTSRNWPGFTGRQGWYLIGAIRVREIVEGGQSIAHLTKDGRERARANAHLSGAERLEAGHRVFLGDLGLSAYFQKAVDLATSRSDGLLYQAFTTADRRPLLLNGKPHWSSSLRTCRRMWDLNRPDDRTRAELIRKAIGKCNSYDLFRGN